VSAPQFTIVPIDGRHQIQDENGAVYGKYATRKEAEENVVRWNEYFDAPLVF